MTTVPLTLRADLNRPLTVEEGDANFTNLGEAIDAIEAAVVVQRTRNPLNARDAPFNAAGNASDDTVALQAAIDAAQARTGSELVLPQREAGLYYKISAPLRVTKPITIRGSGSYATQIIGVGFAPGQHLLEVDCLSTDNVERVHLEGFTLRCLDGVPNALLIKNASYVTVRDVVAHSTANGVILDGVRTFSNSFQGFVGYGIVDATVQFLDTFDGGGQYSFRDSTFSGAYGVRVRAGAITDGVSIDSGNWEGCTTRSVLVNGTVRGLEINAARCEGGGGHGFDIAPVTGREVTGLAIHGMTFYSGTVSARPVILGTTAGTGGRVRGFSIVGNRVGYAGQDYFVTLGEEAQSGLVAGNHFSENTTVPVSVQRLGVVVFSNENGAGRCAEYWGAADWGVEQANWTPIDGSGAGLTFTIATGRYTKVGRTCFWQSIIQYPSTVSSAAAEIGGLPFAVGASAAEGRSGARVDMSNVGSAVGILQGMTSSTEFAFYNPTALTPILNSALSGKILYCSGTYTL